VAGFGVVSSGGIPAHAAHGVFPMQLLTCTRKGLPEHRWFWESGGFCLAQVKFFVVNDSYRALQGRKGS